MSNYLAFDIETTAAPNAAFYFNPDDIKLGNIKDEAKRDAKIAEAKSAHMEKAALSPITGKILAVGFSEDGERSALTYETEAELIVETIKRISDQLMAQRPVTCWNGINFDFPFLFKRAILHDIQWPSHIWDLKKGYPHSCIIDLMRYWNMGNRMEFTKMDTVSRFLGGPGKPSGVTGGDFGKLFNGSDTDRIKAIDYLLNDMKILDHLTKTMLQI